MGTIHLMNEEFGNLANVDLNLLVSLHALVEEGSVTAAADRVGLSQPAMSHALRRIRKLLGDEILIRRGAVNVLTPRARDMLGPLREILQKTTGILGGQVFNPEFSRRTLTLAMSSSVAYIIGQSISLLMERESPEMSLKIITTDDISDSVFTDQGADVLLIAEGYETTHPRERLFDDEWVVVGGHPELLEGDVISCLQDWPHVGLQSARATRPYELLRHRGLEVKMQVHVTDYLVVPQFVAGVRKLALHRRRVVERMARTLPVYVADFPFPILGLGVDMVYNPWQHDDVFRSWVGDLLHRAIAMHDVNNHN